MKVLHLSTSDLDGGAARAAYRLHEGLQQVGANSQMLVRAKTSIDKTVLAEKSILTKLGPTTTGFPLRLYPKRDRTMFSPQWFPDAIAPKVKQINPDIINLHWICNGFLQIETLTKLKKPLVWTLHDMWVFTGGCHYSDRCTEYINACGSCPQLKSNKKNDLSHTIWKRKIQAWGNLNLTIVSPSNWLAECAKSSSLLKNFRIETIPHGLNLKKYQPIDRSTARKLLNLPQDKYLILFGASPGTTGDTRKGFQFLQTVLQKLKNLGWQEKLEIVIFGSSTTKTTFEEGFKAHYLGQYRDDISLALVYSSANLIVVPSIQEAYGQTASEALACGTPVAAFAITGLLDIVDHQYNGYLAQPFDIEDLAQGIIWLIEDDRRHSQLCIHSREKAQREFSDELQASRYLSLYEEIYK